MKNGSVWGAEDQTLTVVALAMVPLLLVVGLVIDGGWAFAQQRRTQNAMDAAANAGAVVVGKNLPFRTRGQAQPKTHTDVLNQVLSRWPRRTLWRPRRLPSIQTSMAISSAHRVPVGSLGAAASGCRVRRRSPWLDPIRHVLCADRRGLPASLRSAQATAVAGAITGICSSDEPAASSPRRFQPSSRAATAVVRHSALLPIRLPPCRPHRMR